MHVACLNRIERFHHFKFHKNGAICERYEKTGMNIVKLPLYTFMHIASRLVIRTYWPLSEGLFDEHENSD